MLFLVVLSLNAAPRDFLKCLLIITVVPHDAENIKLIYYFINFKVTISKISVSFVLATPLVISGNYRCVFWISLLRDPNRVACVMSVRWQLAFIALFCLFGHSNRFLATLAPLLDDWNTSLTVCRLGCFLGMFVVLQMLSSVGHRLSHHCVTLQTFI